MFGRRFGQETDELLQMSGGRILEQLESLIARKMSRLNGIEFWESVDTRAKLMS
jgi:hypothetical protein